MLFTLCANIFKHSTCVQIFSKTELRKTQTLHRTMIFCCWDNVDLFGVKRKESHKVDLASILWILHIMISYLQGDIHYVQRT